MSFVFINLISCLITLRNKPQLQSSGDHVNALILNQLFNLVPHRGILHTAGINKLTGRVRFLSVQTFYGSVETCIFYVVYSYLQCACAHLVHITLRNRTVRTVFRPLYLSHHSFHCSLSVFHVSQPRPNLWSLVIYLFIKRRRRRKRT